ncbi:MAG: hypothetical protein ACFKPT_16755 [Gloeotrichia echinulata GP01]
MTTLDRRVYLRRPTYSNETNPDILCHYSTFTGKAKSQEAPGL